MIQILTRLLAEKHHFVELAFWLAVLFAIGTILLLLYLLWLRLRNYHQLRLMEEVENAWEPVFRAMRKAVPVSKPDIDPAERPVFLARWLDQREHAPPGYAKDLQVLAEQKDLESEILRLLRPAGIDLLTPPASQLAIAVRAARYIDTAAVRVALREVAGRDNQALAIQACESLLALGDRDGIRLVLDLLFRYPEQDRYLTTRLGVAGGEYLVRVLEPFLDKLPNARLEDIVSLASRSEDEAFLPLVERMLKYPRSDEQLASSLRTIARIGTPAQRELVLPHLRSEVDFVRLQAAVALVTVGTMRDIEHLTPLLSDPEWWVRYRSAQSCFRLLSANAEAVNHLVEVQTDRFAQDILKHVRSEMSWYMT